VSPSKAPNGRGAAPLPIDLLVVSAHFDDAAFSCGGLIALTVRHGAAVTVVTVCAAPPDGPLSDYAAGLHRRWGAESEAAADAAAAMVRQRRAEDATALAMLGARGAYLDVPDCIYRRGSDGGWLYASDEALFGPLDALDEPLVERLVSELAALPGLDRRTRVLGPLCAGNHVDHQLARRATVRLAEKRRTPSAFYADFPYSATEGAVEAALKAGGMPVLPSIVPLDAAALAAKIRAAAAYRSQISSFWADEAEMAGAMRRHAFGVGGEVPAELLFEQIPPTGDAK
jgi:LmbE family N-acetylglucosaminyl deacetylase